MTEGRYSRSCFLRIGVGRRNEAGFQNLTRNYHSPGCCVQDCIDDCDDGVGKCCCVVELFEAGCGSPLEYFNVVCGCQSTDGAALNVGRGDLFCGTFGTIDSKSFMLSIRLPLFKYVRRHDSATSGLP